MASRYNKICFLCGKEYRYCSNCKDFRTQPTWKNMFDTKNCYKIFSLSTQFAQGVYTKEEANAILKNYDLSDIDTYRQDAIEQIRIIQSADNNRNEEINLVNINKKKDEDNKSKETDAKGAISEASTFKKKKKSMKRASN